VHSDLQEEKEGEAINCKKFEFVLTLSFLRLAIPVNTDRKDLSTNISQKTTTKKNTIFLSPIHPCL
jgi:hypothetical protein